MWLIELAEVRCVSYVDQSRCLNTSNVCTQQAISFYSSLRVEESCCVVIVETGAAYDVALHSIFLC